jgi:hypothetical protein
MPVRVKKMRRNKDLELLSDSAESESALAAKLAERPIKLVLASWRKRLDS